VIIDGNIAPLFTAFATLFLRPLYLDLTAIPSKDQDDARHFELEGVVLLHLHAQYLCLAGDQAELHLVSGCVVVLFDHISMQCGNGELNGFDFFLTLHQYIIYKRIQIINLQNGFYVCLESRERSITQMKIGAFSPYYHLFLVINTLIYYS
jgi:hypothetical protein